MERGIHTWDDIGPYGTVRQRFCTAAVSIFTHVAGTQSTVESRRLCEQQITRTGTRDEKLYSSELARSVRGDEYGMGQGVS